MFLDKAEKEIDKLELEAEESLLAWNGKEMSFIIIMCTIKAELEWDLVLHEAYKLNESLKATKQENFRLRMHCLTYQKSHLNPPS